MSLSHYTRFFFFACLSVLTVSGVEPPPESSQWSRVQNGQFEIFTDAGEKKALDLALAIDRMMVVIDQTTDLHVDSDRPTRIFAFRDSAGFRPFRDGLIGADTDKAGVFAFTRYANYILLDVSSKRSEEILFHELTHLFIRNSFGAVPLWLNEGLAMFYESAKIRDGLVVLGIPDQRTVALLGREKLVPTREMLELTGRTEEFRRGPRSTVIYAQGWGMVHHLLVDNSEGPGQLRDYLALQLAGEPRISAFEKAFETTAEEYDRIISTYVRRGKFSHVSAPIGDLPARTVTAHPVTRSALLRELGTLLIDGEAEPDAALALLEQSVVIDNQDAEAFAALGMALEAKGELENALAAYQRSLSIDPANKRAQFHARVLSDRLKPPLTRSDQATESSPEVISWVEEVREWATERLETAENAEERAELHRILRTTNPRDSFTRLHALYDQAIALANAQKLDEALETVDTLLTEAREGGLFYEAARDLRKQILAQRR